MYNDFDCNLIAILSDFPGLRFKFEVSILLNGVGTGEWALNPTLVLLYLGDLT